MPIFTFRNSHSLSYFLRGKKELQKQSAVINTPRAFSYLLFLLSLPRSHQELRSSGRAIYFAHLQPSLHARCRRGILEREGRCRIAPRSSRFRSAARHCGDCSTEARLCAHAFLVRGGTLALGRPREGPARVSGSVLPPGAREGEGDLYCPRSERGRDGCAAAGGQCEIGWYFSARVRSGSCCTSGFSSSAARPAAPGSNTRQVGGGGGAEPPSLHACRPPAGEAMGQEASCGRASFAPKRRSRYAGGRLTVSESGA